MAAVDLAQGHHARDVDAVIIPGVSVTGDYLRCGAIARFSPVMQAVGSSRRTRPGARRLQRFQILA